MNLAEKLQAAIKAHQRRVLFIGDVLVDRWVHGRLEDSQDGCQKFMQEEVIETPGGAANAANCLAHWGVVTLLYGYANNDCPVKTRYLAGDRIVFRADDDGHRVRGSGYGWKRSLALDMIPHTDAVLISDYDKGFLPHLYIRQVAEACKKHGIPCVADCKREPELYAGCILKGNHNYTVEKCYRCDVVTRGANPPIVNHEGIYPPAAMQPVRCVNHVGAGDCFAAHLVLALAYGFSLSDSAAFAHSAGRVYVQHRHNRPPHPIEVAADLTRFAAEALDLPRLQITGQIS